MVMLRIVRALTEGAFANNIEYVRVLECDRHQHRRCGIAV